MPNSVCMYVCTLTKTYVTRTSRHARHDVYVAQWMANGSLRTWIRVWPSLK